MSISLKQCIMNLKKASMQSNAALFGEKLPSSLNKDSMAQRLAEIYKQNSQAILPMLSIMVVTFLRMIFEKDINEELHAHDYSNHEKYASFELIYDQLEYLGLIDYTDGKINVPDIFKNIVPDEKLDAQLAEWQRMEMCADGIISAYGIIEDKAFHRIFNDCYPQLSREDAAAFLSRRIDLLIYCGRISINDETWWFSSLMDAPEDWYMMMETRDNIPYRKYSRDEYIQISMSGFARKPKNFDKLVSVLKDTGMSLPEAEETLWSAAVDHCCELDMQSGVPDFIKMHTWDSMDDVQGVVSLYTGFENDTPIWYNKGHSPNEINQLIPPYKGKPQFIGPYASEMSAAYDNLMQKEHKVIPFPTGASSSKKPGRNAPCPCGSGKKYKNCCGRRDKDE